LNKIDLSNIDYRNGGIWGFDSPANLSWRWLCERTDHPILREASRRCHILIDDQPVDVGVTMLQAHSAATAMQATQSGLVQIFDGSGWYIVTYHTMRSSIPDNNYQAEQFIHILIEDDLLAIEFKLSAPWERPLIVPEELW
jgi:hypothetical protein